MRSRRVILAVALTVAAVPGAASGYVIGATPLAAAFAAARKHAAHEVVAWNRPGVSYTMGACNVLHRRPYLAYTCGWQLHGVPDYCHGRLTVAVRRQADRQWRAAGVKSWYTDDRGC